MKRNDNIGKLIQENRSKFDCKEPEEGHFERFEQKINISSTKKPTILRAKSFLLGIAATLLAFFVITNILPNKPTKYAEIKRKKLSTVSPNLNDIEIYFTGSISNSLEEWNKLKKAGYINQQEQKLLKKELAEFEETYKNLQKDLAKNPNDKRIIEAMIYHYQTKLKMINMIISQLNEAKEKQDERKQSDQANKKYNI